MRYCLMVSGAAYGAQRASSALQFAEALLAAGHRLDNVFFYQDGVSNANRYTSPAGDEQDIVRDWQRFGLTHGVALDVCVSAALRRGVIDNDQGAGTVERIGSNLQPGFTLSGLGTLAQALLECDRFIQF
ncbi:sulfurtransferase complex subunit TusD [Acerihabitans sp. TG2]|uniref:sulfurtransferase complex subunit TusD n=1 Tax=Acerihabitans sp. TG2 TaxID=3096008 RepID=UPI002B228D33|nr:sulfurtransferase complex subunit TusD [Acerihabitans sp. TG2]MEA9390866.1 sulfurtransferase complex subunit TusD [Acerihabitans sp. TG2]